MQKLHIKNEDLEFYSPFTGLPCTSDGRANTQDPSLAYIYIEETDEFEYINPLFTAITQQTSINKANTLIDLLVELDDGIAGGNVLLGYKAI